MRTQCVSNDVSIKTSPVLCKMSGMAGMDSANADIFLYFGLSRARFMHKTIKRNKNIAQKNYKVFLRMQLCTLS